MSFPDPRPSTPPKTSIITAFRPALFPKPEFSRGADPRVRPRDSARGESQIFGFFREKRRSCFLVKVFQNVFKPKSVFFFHFFLLFWNQIFSTFFFENFVFGLLPPNFQFSRFLSLEKGRFWALFFSKNRSFSVFSEFAKKDQKKTFFPENDEKVHLGRNRRTKNAEKGRFRPLLCISVPGTESCDFWRFLVFFESKSRQNTGFSLK